MKKMTAVLMVLAMLLTAVVAAAAEEPSFTFRNGVSFGMNMDSVIASETVQYHEIEREHTRGPVSFTELEYENVTENGVRADLTYLFAENELAAIRVGYETRDISYNQLKADLTAKYGESSAVNMAELGVGIYAVDDDGRLEGRAEAFVSGSVMIILELDEDDMDVTYVDLAAAYLK